jgi:hypothetical protein
MIGEKFIYPINKINEEIFDNMFIKLIDGNKR